MKKPQGDIETLADMVDFCAMFHANWLPTLKSKAGNAVEEVTRRKVFPIYTYALLEACVEFSRWDEKFSETYDLWRRPDVWFLLDLMQFHGRAVTKLYQEFPPDEIMALTYFRHSLVHINISAHRSIPIQVFTPEFYVIEQSKTKDASESMEKIGKVLQSYGGPLKFSDYIFEKFCSTPAALWPLVGEIMRPERLRELIVSVVNEPEFRPTDDLDHLAGTLVSIKQTLHFPTLSLAGAPYWTRTMDGDQQL